MITSEKNVLNYSNRIICNPYFQYGASWTIVVFLYLLDWSYKYPKLSVSLMFFLLATCMLTLVLAYKTHKQKKFSYNSLKTPDDYYSWIMNKTKWIYFLLCLEFVAFKGVPLYLYMKGMTDTRAYMEFGIPILHIVVFNSVMLLFYFSSYCFFSAGGVNHFIKPMVINFLAPILFMSRGTCVYMLFGMFLIYLMSGKNAMKTLLKLIPFAILALYMFGIMGNLRIGDPDGKLIKQWGGATETFDKSGVPSEFFWSYVYITSPLGNLQNAVDQYKLIDRPSTGVLPLVVNEILPMFISKRVDLPDLTNRDYYYVDPTMVVGSTYFDPFLTWGWGGMILVFLCILFYITLMERLIPSDSPFRVPLYVVLANLAFFSLFDNMLVFMGLFPQLVLIFLFRNLKISKSSI